MSAWPSRRLGELLRPAGEVVRVREDCEYPNFGMYSYARGLFRKPAINGLATSALSLVRVRKGQFIYSRLFAFEGAYGVVDSEFDGCYISNEYPVFDIDGSQVMAQYLHAYFRVPRTWEAIARGSKGVGVRRQRVQPEHLLAHAIPLPPLPQQQRLVAFIDQITSHLVVANSLRNESAAAVTALLAARQNQVLGEAASEDWVPLSRLVVGLEGGASPQCESRPAAEHEWGVLKVGAVSFGQFDGEEQKALPPGRKFDDRAEVQDGDLLMSRANTPDLVGACCVVRLPRPRLLLSDKTLRFRFATEDKTVVQWLDWVLKAPALRVQIAQAASGTSPTMKNISKQRILALRVPPHDNSMQGRIVSELDALKAEIDALKAAQAARRAELDALLPAVLDRAFAGAL